MAVMSRQRAARHTHPLPHFVRKQIPIRKPNEQQSVESVWDICEAVQCITITCDFNSPAMM